MKRFFDSNAGAPVLAFFLACGSVANAAGPDCRTLGRENQSVHRFSTLFTAQDVRDRLNTDEGIDRAIQWCRDTAVTKVYLESFRDGYQAERATLARARDRLREAGIEVSGCVTPTGVGKRSTGWEVISCYTDGPTQDRVQTIFEFVAGLFDEVMIDDFWFTDCACPECQRGRSDKLARVGQRAYPVSGDTWEDYRCELMVRVSQDRVLAVAKAVNPKVRLIIKYPQWYDRFHERGYEVIRQTSDFDWIWVGTETRDYDDSRWGGTVPYEAYFIMRWLGGIGGAKCGGGWYDWLGTTEQTYLEQARQTILAGARESMLFCYGGLQGTTGPKNIAALRENLPELFAVAREVQRREAIGIAAYKPANSHPENEPRVFDFVGMLGLPLAPCHEFPDRARAAFFSVHALKDPGFVEKIERFLDRGRPVLLTDGLAARLEGKVRLDRLGVRILPVKGDPKSLLELSAEKLNALRKPLLEPFRARLEAPNQVGLYLFRDGSWVLENFNQEPVNVVWQGERRTLPARGWACEWK